MKDRIALLVNSFKEIKDWEDRYKTIIELGRELDEMPAQMKIDENLVKGCQSQVWLFAQIDSDKTIKFMADSDASIAKGIVALLLKIYSGSTPEEILEIKTDFIDELGLRQHLSMNRSNGLNSMLKQIKFYALAFQMKMKLEK